MKTPATGQTTCQLPQQQPEDNACTTEGQHTTESQRTAGYEIVPQRGKARFKVRYREGSLSSDCKLCR